MKNLYKIEDELYIVDNTEEINKDTKICWCINTSNNEVVLHQGVLPAYHYKYYKKIIMTTNTSINLLCGCGKNCGAKESGIQAIDDDFIEWFVNNPSCDEVEVGYGWIRLTETDNEGYWVSIPDKQFEMQQEEPKQETTLEEAAENKYMQGVYIINGIDICELSRECFIEGAKSDAAKDYWYAKWQQQDSSKDTADYIDKNLVQALVEVAKQNPTVYSEEEVIAFTQWMYDYKGDINKVEELLKQFKKK
jgi:hypothetical protein